MFLAHLSHRLMVSCCHQQMSVVRRPSSTIASNDISAETAKPGDLIFGMWHCLVDLYQVWSNSGPGVQNCPAAGVLGSKMKYI